MVIIKIPPPISNSAATDEPDGPSPLIKVHAFELHIHCTIILKKNPTTI